jgi:hypothetical protein
MIVITHSIFSRYVHGVVALIINDAWLRSDCCFALLI